MALEWWMFIPGLIIMIPWMAFASFRWWQKRDSGYLFGFVVFLMVLPASEWSYYSTVLLVIILVVVFSIAISARVWWTLTERAEERAPEETLQEETQPEIGEPETSSPASPLELVCPHCGYRNPHYARICARCGRHSGEIAPEEVAPEEVESEKAKPVSPFDVLCFYCGHENPRDATFCIRCGRYLGETCP